jgi:excisionase family DNA binding protein
MTNRQFGTSSTGGAPQRAFYSTQEAADVLGVSRTTVQQMVELGQLRAWKTAGGHRRIDPASVHHLIHSSQPAPATPLITSDVRYRILAAEDDPHARRLYEMQVEEWQLPIEMRTVGNGVDALVHIARWVPNLLILDLVMPGLDGYEVARRLKQNPDFADLDILIGTGADLGDDERLRRLPRGVALMRKPMQFDRLREYVTSALARLQSFEALGAGQR